MFLWFSGIDSAISYVEGYVTNIIDSTSDEKGFR